jgi:uncharacterized protein
MASPLDETVSKRHAISEFKLEAHIGGIQQRLDWAKGYGQNGAMNRDQVIATLRHHESELRAAGVVRLSIFGSTARGDRRPDSDIDLLACFDESLRLSLLDVVGIELHLADLLGQPVDLSEEGTLKPRVQKRVEAEAVRAF